MDKEHETESQGCTQGKVLRVYPGEGIRGSGIPFSEKDEELRTESSQNSQKRIRVF